MLFVPLFNNILNISIKGERNISNKGDNDHGDEDDDNDSYDCING